MILFGPNLLSRSHVEVVGKYAEGVPSALVSIVLTAVWSMAGASERVKNHTLMNEEVRSIT
jgi:hypothetical protein